MQGVRYVPGNIYGLDHIGGGPNGNLWQLVNNGVTCNGGRIYSVSPEASSFDYNKELVRQTMLKQEAIFRAQVHELHRVYKRQRELMNEVRARELSIERIQKQSSQSCFFSSNVQYELSHNSLQMPQWLLLNPRGSMPSTLGQGNFQKQPLNSVSEKSWYTGSVICHEESYLREDRESFSKRRNCGKTILDLELPAEAYTDGEKEVGEPKHVEESQFPLDPFTRTAGPPNDGLELNKASSFNANSSSRKTCFLLDLNESPQVDESETEKCVSFLQSHSSIMGFMLQDPCGNVKSVSPLPEGDIQYGVHDIKGTNGRPLFGNDCSLPCSAFTNSCPSPDEAKTEASTSVALQKTSPRNVLDSSAITQAPLCFNTSECLSESSRSSPMNSKLKRTESKGPSSMGSVTACISETERCVKEPNAANSFKEMDLNVTPSSCLTDKSLSRGCISSTEVAYMFEDPAEKLCKLNGQPDSDNQLSACPKFARISESSQLSAIASSSVHLKSSEDEDGLNCAQPGVSSNSHSSDRSEIMYIKKNSGVANGIDEDLPKTKTSSSTESSLIQLPQMEVQSNVSLPIGPDDKEHSPPLKNEPDNNQKEIPFQSVQKRGDPTIGIDEIAAETIIAISQSGPQDLVKTTSTSAPVEASSDCLDWFAGIVCSSASDPKLKFKRLENVTTNHNVDVPGGIGRSKGMRLNPTGSRVDDHFSATKCRRNRSCTMSVQQEKPRAKRARQTKRFKSKVMRDVDSISSCDMNENVQPRNVAFERNLNRKTRANRSRRSASTSDPHNGRTGKICSGAYQLTNDTELCWLQSYLSQWGKKSSRQDGRRARADGLPWSWADLVPC